MKPPPLSLNREHEINGSEKKELKLKLQRISILLRIFMIWHFPHFPIIFLYFFISCQDYLNETAPPPPHTHIFYVPVIISLRICQQKEIKLGLVNVTLVPSNEGWKKICNHTIHTEYCCPIHPKKNRKFFYEKGYWIFPFRSHVTITRTQTQTNVVQNIRASNIHIDRLFKIVIK